MKLGLFVLGVFGSGMLWFENDGKLMLGKDKKESGSVHESPSGVSHGIDGFHNTEVGFNSKTEVGFNSEMSGISNSEMSETLVTGIFETPNARISETPSTEMSEIWGPRESFNEMLDPILGSKTIESSIVPSTNYIQTSLIEDEEMMSKKGQKLSLSKDYQISLSLEGSFTHKMPLEDSFTQKTPSLPLKILPFIIFQRRLSSTRLLMISTTLMILMSKDTQNLQTLYQCPIQLILQLLLTTYQHSIQRILQLLLTTPLFT